MNKLSLPSYLVIKDGIQGLGVFAAAEIKKGQLIFKLDGDIVSRPTRTSVQIGSNMHVENAISSFLNHNCHPNTMVDITSGAFVALSDIKEGEELTFDYHANEDELAAPFTCRCCGKKIVGKKALQIQSSKV